MTYRQIADKSNMSYQTVYRTMNALIESNFLTKINSGAYRVNPDVLFKGGKDNRLNVLLQYRNEKTINNTSHCVSLSKMAAEILTAAISFFYLRAKYFLNN